MSTLALAVALRVSLALALGLAVRALLRRRSPAVRHAVLAAALVAAPFAATLGVLSPVVPLPAMARSVPAPAPVIASPMMAAAPIDAVPGAIASTIADRETSSGPWLWVSTIWAAGALGAVGVLVAGAWRLRRIAAASRPATDARWRTALAEAIADAGLRRPVDLRIATSAPFVATWGWRRPRIVVSAEALTWTDERLAAVLAHELAHVRRHDWALQWLAETLRALLWWNPLAWVACRALRDDSELACDDAVLGTGVPAATYAGHLLAIARTASRAAMAVPVTPMARPSTLERRIVVMLDSTRDHRVPPGRALAGAVLGLAALLAPVAVLGGAQAARQPLEGVVYDSTGAVLPGVAMTLVTGSGSEKTTTDAAGHFTFGVVDPGRHTLQAEVPGFGKLQQPIELKQDADWTRAIMLSVGELRETITVRSRRPIAPTPLASAGPTPVRVGGNIRAPRKLKNVNPIYPDRMRDAGLEAAVEVEAFIGVDGSVTNARVVSASIHPDFAIAAIDAVRQWQFEPTLLNGKPVAVVMTVSIDFGLD